MTYPDEPVARIAPLPAEQLTPEQVAILERIPGKGLKGDGFPRNVLGVLMRNEDTLGPFLDYWVTSKSKLGLTVREQELVILRMAVHYRSDYVWKHHVKVGREFGIVDDEMDALRAGAYAAIASPRERALLEAVDACMDRRSIPADLWRALRATLSERDLVDTIALVSQYVLFALANVCCQVQVEDAVAGLPGIEG